MDTQIRETAARWLVELRTDTPGAAVRRDFAAWLRASPEHIRAYLDMLALWEDARCYDPHHNLDIDSLVALACTDHTVIGEVGIQHRPDRATTRITPEKGDANAITSRKPIRNGLLQPRTAIAALLSIVINCGIAWYVMDSQRAAYSTRIGEQRSVQLPDGSRVDLDADSDVRTNFTPQERTVELISGEALFHVKKDPSRPFIVRIGDARVRDIGTEFDVNRTTLGTVVTVLEGRVSVFASVSGTEVDAGQQTTITRAAVAVPRAVDTAAVTAWTRKLLVFSSTPLPEVAEEFNRFNSRRLVIASRELADVQVTGTFGAFDPDSLARFVRLLRAQPGIEVVEKNDQIIVQVRSAHQRRFAL